MVTTIKTNTNLFGHWCLINTNPRVRHSTIAPWILVSFGANTVFKLILLKYKPCILEHPPISQAERKFSVCFCWLDFFSCFGEVSVCWVTGNYSTVKILSITIYVTKIRIWVLTQFFSLRVNSCLWGQTRQLIQVVFLVGTRKRTVFLHQQKI